MVTDLQFPDLPTLALGHELTLVQVCTYAAVKGPYQGRPGDHVIFSFDHRGLCPSRFLKMQLTDITTHAKIP